MSAADPPVRRCPVCENALVPTSIRGVTVDTCAGHGLWLDQGELETVMAKQKRTAEAVRRHAVREARRQGVWDGIFWDWIALFFPDPDTRPSDGKDRKPNRSNP